MADATGELGSSGSQREREDCDSKQGKEENEFCLDEMAKVLTLGTGELVASKIVGYVQNQFRLVSLERIEESNCTVEICKELKKLSDANVADEVYVETVLAKLRKLVGFPTDMAVMAVGSKARSASLRKLLQNGRMKLVLDSMTMHPNSTSVTIYGGHILLRMAKLLRGLTRNGTLLERGKVDPIYSFLISDSCMMKVIGAMENHQDDLCLEGVTLLAFLGLSLGGYASMQTPSALEFQATYLQQLEQKNVLPLVWYLLQKHVTVKSIVSDEFCSVACSVLIQKVGGADRPIIKQLLVEQILEETSGETFFKVIHRMYFIHSGGALSTLARRARLEFRMLAGEAFQAAVP